MATTFNLDHVKDYATRDGEKTVNEKCATGHGINCIEYNVLVKPKSVDEKTTGGLYIPDDTKEREQFAMTEGVLVAVSPAAFTFNYEGWPEGARLPQEGDKVFFARYQATEIKGMDGENYWIMKDRAIAAVIE